jgi:hypothetical protein
VGIDDNATSTKLTVANTGIDVTGSVTCDELNVSTVGTNRVDISNTSLTDTGEMVSLQWDTNADFTIQGRDSAAGFKANWYRIEASASDGLADSHIWYTGTSAEAMRIDSAGNVTVKTGNLVIGTSGKGIDFSAVSDGSRSVSSNLLDDYEEGTWTPGLSGGTAGYAVRVGNYTKIGNTVRLRCSIKLSSWAGTGAVAVTGVPFASVATGYNHDWGVAMMTNKPNSKTWLTGGDGSTSIFFRQQDVTNGDTALAHTDIDADTAIMFTIVYMTA